MMIALELGEAIEAAEGSVIGPARSVTEALRVPADDQVDTAILDRTLLDGKATSVTLLLMECVIPFMVNSPKTGELKAWQ